MSWPATMAVPEVGVRIVARRRKRGGLARAVGTEQAVHAAGLAPEAHFVHGAEDAALAVVELLAELLRDDHRIQRAAACENPA